MKLQLSFLLVGMAVAADLATEQLIAFELPAVELTTAELSGFEPAGAPSLKFPAGKGGVPGLLPEESLAAPSWLVASAPTAEQSKGILCFTAIPRTSLVHQQDDRGVNEDDYAHKMGLCNK
ncbi:hypothetical protein E4U55_003501 [Claviceps digitariae]|nr:hypothetical protein E4U55_003501 [Claviceps digitariae]